MNPILKSSRSIALLASATAFSATTNVHADLTKANNTNALNLATSWTNGTLTPTSSDVLIWGATVSGANSVVTGAPLSALGLSIVSPGGAVTITSDATNTLSLGASGIDMSSATQNLTLSGAGSVLSAAQSWTVGTGRTLTVNNNLNTGSISTLTIGGDGNTTIGAVIATTSNTTSIAKNGGGTLTLSGNQGSSTNRINNIALNAGTLAVNHQNAIQGTVTAAGGTTMNSNAGSFSNLNLSATGNISINSGSATRYGSITGDANTLTFLTGTTLNRGASTLNGTTLDVRSGATFQTGADQNNNTTSTSTITKTGGGTWTLNNGQLSATTGITVNAGILRNNSADRIANTTAVTIDGSTAVYDLQTFTETVGAVSLKNGGSITGTSTGALTGSSFALESGSVSAILAGSGNLTKTTSATVTLSGINSYGGTTQITGGMLKLGTGGSIANSSQIIVGANTTLDVSSVSFALGASSAQQLSGTGTIVGNMTVNSNGTLAIGTSPGTMTFDGNLGLNTGSVSNFEINAFSPGNYDLAVASTLGSQSVNFSGGTLNLLFQSGFSTLGAVKLFDFDIYAGTGFTSVLATGLAPGLNATFDATNGFVTVVPEPRAALLGCLGLVALLRRRRSL